MSQRNRGRAVGLIASTVVLLGLFHGCLRWRLPTVSEPYFSRSLGFAMAFPEGWTRREGARGVQFSDPEDPFWIAGHTTIEVALRSPDSGEGARRAPARTLPGSVIAGGAIPVEIAIYGPTVQRAYTNLAVEYRLKAGGRDYRISVSVLRSNEANAIAPISGEVIHEAILPYLDGFRVLESG